MDGLGVGRRGALLGGLAAALGGAAPGGAEPDAPAGHAAFRAELLAFLDDTAWRCFFPVSADVSAPDHTILNLAGAHPDIWIALNGDWAIDVGVDWNGECWDLLACFDVSAHPVAGGGWVNGLFVPEAQVVRPSREEVWREDGFELLLEWLNEQLAAATHVGLWGEPGHATWAWLVRNGVTLRGGRSLQGDEAPDHLFPVHV